jgi:heparan-alpha-glucosaminide N-acetyltransferase
LNQEQPGRLLSLDAYRGLVMLAMVSGGLGIPTVAEHFPDHAWWQHLSYQLEHVPWAGCSAWDLIQPSFMFIVGVAMPYSLKGRQTRGDSTRSRWGHALWRAMVLVALGIFLRSNGRDQTNFTFEDVSTQIGLGYFFIFLLLGRSWLWPATAALLILVGYHALFELWPKPPATFDPVAAGIPNDWNQFSGRLSAWNKHLNPAGYFDHWFLNLFPRATPFVFNGGGYQTLSFIPSMATTLFGVLAGMLLLLDQKLWWKILILFVWGLAFLAIGTLADSHVWPGQGEWCYAPVVKRIWTPSWAIYSTGWTLVTLALLVMVIDAWGWKGWSFPLYVVGMNSIAMYVMSWLLKPWLKVTFRTHLGKDIFAGTYGPILESTLLVLVLWLICYWMHRQRIYIRI